MVASLRHYLIILKTICFVVLLAHSQAQTTSFGSISLTCSSSGQSTAFNTNIPYSTLSFIIIEAEASIPLPFQALLIATLEDQSFFLFSSALIKNTRAYTVIDTTKIPPQYSSKYFNIQCINSSELSFQINLNFKGSNTMLTETDIPCPFNCSNDSGNGKCSALNECQCSQGFFGIDCGIEGENIQSYLNNQSMSSISFFGSKLFYLQTSSLDINSQFIEMKSLISQSLKLYTYHGSQSSFLINNSYDLSPSSEIQTQELVFDSSSSTSDFIYVILQDITSKSEISIDTEFSVKTIEKDDNGFFSGRNVFSIIIICLISFFSLLILIGVIFSIRSLYNYCHREQIALYKNNQMQIQIEQKMPSQTHGQLLQHFPNLSEIPECNICLEEFVPNDKVRLTHCFHVFHTSCLTEWMLSRHSLLCPLCRKSCQESDAEACTLYKLKMRSENNSPHELTLADTFPHKTEGNHNSEKEKLQNQATHSQAITPIDTAETIKEKVTLNTQEIQNVLDKSSNKIAQAVNKSTTDHQAICITPRTETEQEHFSIEQPFFKETKQAEEQPQSLTILTKQQPLQTQQVNIPKYRSE